MGGGHSIFTEEELITYQTLTFLTRAEILEAYKRFRALDPSVVAENKNAKLSREIILSLPELKVNPFKERIVTVFSSTGDGIMAFDDFLEMISIFSDSASIMMKIQYAFRIYDFDEDNYIGKEDLKEIINALTGSQILSDDVINQLIHNILEEADIDEDGHLSLKEFEHVISKCPDFFQSFRIRF